MPIEESGLTGAQRRRRNALRKSLGEKRGARVFSEWLSRRPRPVPSKPEPDPVAQKIAEALAGFENDPDFNLGNRGYTVRRDKGRDAAGFLVHKNRKPR